jgi:hypothetical protein
MTVQYMFANKANAHDKFSPLIEYGTLSTLSSGTDIAASSLFS